MAAPERLLQAAMAAVEKPCAVGMLQGAVEELGREMVLQVALHHLGQAAVSNRVCQEQLQVVMAEGAVSLAQSKVKPWILPQVSSAPRPVIPQQQQRVPEAEQGQRASAHASSWMAN